MELSGKIKVIFDIKEINANMSKREFVITTDERYPADILFETFNEKTSILQPFKAGDVVKVSFDIRGKEYNGRYYNNLRAWKIDRAGVESQSPPPMDTPPPLPPLDDDPITDDLPF